MSRVYLPPYIKPMMDHLYLSDQRARIDEDKFKLVIDTNYPQNGVRLGEIQDSSHGGTRTIRLGVDDSEEQDMTGVLDYVLPIIGEYVKSGQKVLIFSHEGWSRSAMVLSSYLIKAYGFKMRDLSHVFQTSGYLQRLNPYFKDQLELMTKDN
jgi:hypothetical protein